MPGNWRGGLAVGVSHAYAVRSHLTEAICVNIGDSLMTPRLWKTEDESFVD